MTRLAVYLRAGCGLCDEMLAELAPWADSRGLIVEVRDVDADPVTRRRFGYRIPVLCLDDEAVCHGTLDLGALERLLPATG